METGVNGDHGVYVPRHVVVEQGHDINHVTIQHQQMAVLLAQDWTMKRRHALHHNAKVGVIFAFVFFLSSYSNWAVVIFSLFGISYDIISFTVILSINKQVVLTLCHLYTQKNSGHLISRCKSMLRLKTGC